MTKLSAWVRHRHKVTLISKEVDSEVGLKYHILELKRPRSSVDRALAQHSTVDNFTLAKFCTFVVMSSRVSFSQKCNDMNIFVFAAYLWLVLEEAHYFESFHLVAIVSQIWKRIIAWCYIYMDCLRTKLVICIIVIIIQTVFCHVNIFRKWSQISYIDSCSFS